MAVTVAPWIEIDGARVQCTADALDRAPLAVGGFSIDWGREEYLTAKGEPSTATVTLIDTTTEWARLIRANLAQGLHVKIGWEADDGTRGTAFRGRVARGIAAPTLMRAADNRRAWRIELTCADYSADLGNVRPTPGVWPRETLLDRAIRIRDLGTASGAGISQMWTHTRHHGDYVAPLEVRDETALALMQDMYGSQSNETYTYDHSTGDCRQVVRLRGDLVMHLVSFDTDTGAVSIAPKPLVYDGVTYPGLAIAGCQAASDIEVETSVESSINRVEITYPAFEANHEDRRIAAHRIRPGDGPRLLDFDSWLESTPVISQMADYVLAKATSEASKPKHPAFTVKQGHRFRTIDEARWLLSTWETPRPAFINGDLPARWLMQGDEANWLPVIAPIGGKLEFHPAHGWAIQIIPAWFDRGNDAQNPATWASLRQIRTTYEQPSYPWWWPLLGRPIPAPVPVGSAVPERDIRWGTAGEMPYYGFDTSVMWGDMAHVASENTQIKDM